MDLRIVPIDNGQVTVMDRDNLDAGAIYTTPDGLSYEEAVQDAERWAERHNAENVVDKLTRLLAGETVEGLSLGSAGITREFCEEALPTYQAILAKP